MKKMFRAAALAAAFLVAVLAADVSGKWNAQVPGRGGQTRDVTFNFKADGDKLTGTMSGFRGDLQIADGKVASDDISFKVKMEFGGNAMTMSYEGKVAGDEIKFKRTVEGRDGVQEFTAKKAQ